MADRQESITQDQAATREGSGQPQAQPEKAQPQQSEQKHLQTKRNQVEARIERAFCKAVEDAGGLALKFTSQTMNGVPDRLILFKVGKCAFVELKAPGKQMRPLQRKRRQQLEALGFPVFCVDSKDQIEPVIKALRKWKPGQPFPTGVGAAIPEIKEMELPGELQGEALTAAAQTDGSKPMIKEVVPDEVHTA